MDIDFKKLAPWNWFKKEQEEQQNTASLPVQRNDLPVAGGPVSPILQLHREIDRLFREHNIEIPFSQHDLHIRSIDVPAKAALSEVKNSETVLPASTTGS